MLNFDKLIDVQQEKMYRIYSWPIYELWKNWSFLWWEISGGVRF